MTQAYKIFNRKFSMKNLNVSYESIIKRNTAAGLDKMRKSNFDNMKNEQLKIVCDKVSEGTYKYTYYKEKLIVKNRDSLPRMISIPTLRDRIVLKLLHEFLMETFKVDMKLVQTVVSDLIRKSLPFDSYIKIDMENFFGSLNHDILMKKINRKIRKKEIRDLISNAIKTPTANQFHRKGIPMLENTKGVPQGVPIANVLAEIYLQNLDDTYKEKKNVAYFRYVDDIIIFCNCKDIPAIKKDIIEVIESDLDLKVNVEKTTSGTLKEGMNFLGYSFRKEKGHLLCSVKKESIFKVENAIVAIFSKYKNSKGKMSPKEFAFYLNLKVTGSIVKDIEKGGEKKFGWLFFYSQINDIRVLYHLDFLINKFIVDYKMEDALKGIEIKSFVKAYYEITQRRSKSKYIFRPSDLSMVEKKALLNEVFLIPLVDLKSEKKINLFFNKRVTRKIEELEMDIQHIS